MSLAAKKINRYGAIPFLIDSFFNEVNNVQSYKAPMANVSEDNDNYYAELALPGVKKEDVQIEVKEGFLKISSKKVEEKEESNEGNGDNNVRYYRKEFNYSTFQRMFPLPLNKVNADAIDAKLENGVLLVTVPKKEEAKENNALQIEVK